MTAAEPDGAAQAARDRLADRLDRYARRSLLGVVPLALIGLVDLLTGSLTEEPRIDLVLLAASALAVCSALAQRRLARRLRMGSLPRGSKKAQWARAGASVVLTLAVGAGLGYALGGWIAAVVIPAATVLLAGYGVARGLRQRRRLEAERALVP